MPVRELLKSVVDRCEGAAGIVLMDFDGIAIDEYISEEGSDVHVTAIEYVAVLKEIRNAIEVLKSGDLEEVAVSTATNRLIVKLVAEDLFVMLCLSADGNFGKARYLLKLYAPELRLALS